ncbi:MAG: CcmD family protein [Anaerolineae bacterium]
MAFMVAAYLIIWLAAFAFILNMMYQQNKLQNEIALLKELLKEKRARE